MLSLPAPLAQLTAPLFRVLPLEQAMPHAVVDEPLGGEASEVVSQLVKLPQIGEKSTLAAGLWLYVDDLDASHKISQGFEGKGTFDYWHCIMHRLEGDFPNSRYWLRRAGKHPAMTGDERALIDAAEAVEEAEDEAGAAKAEFLAKQRAEWVRLMTWCWENKK